MIEGVSISFSGKIAIKTCQMLARQQTFKRISKSFLSFCFDQNIDVFFCDLLARFYCYISDQVWFCVILHDLNVLKLTAVHIKNTHFFPLITIFHCLFFFFCFSNIFIFTREIKQIVPFVQVFVVVGGFFFKLLLFFF